MVKIYRSRNYREMSETAAGLFLAQIRKKPDSVLGLATGGTPVGLYQNLVQAYQRGEADFSRLSTLNLDEYQGLSGEDPHSYRYFINTQLFDHVNIEKTRTHVPDGTELHPEKACRDYDRLIARLGPVDLQLLGLGPNGHIAFNEPDDIFPSGTHCVTLDSSTIEANRRFFRSLGEVPKRAYTMGIGSIFSARQILLLVSGTGKAEILKQALSGPVTPRLPASILQFHPDVTLIADEDALSSLPR